ncbi:MAG: hypothetical protein OXK80_00410 [Bdellovibrionales bacterium]|nr:hypothetical protein [Bdellovibrionales bacterium]
MKTKRGSTPRYKCNDCGKLYTKRTNTLNYRKRKQHLRETITQMYCERMSLRGIARTLGIDIKTVVRYFLENAEVSKAKNRKRLDTKDLVTSYVQFDQLETYEHTRKRPIGIQISIRHKTGEIISAKAGYTNVRALSTASVYTQAWNEKVKRNSKHTEKMLKETKKALNPKGSLISCDAEKNHLDLLRICTQSLL